ncbi:MAG: hypothetical protein BZY87_10125 [SAR202 cluster bacterium Io17-Chloro-G6]|nr:MAG: hypothetical protein BZY87_10125 [SAR202 cluster bacterium Io17-Chloro-G6]
MRLPNILNQLNDAVFLIDPGEGRIADANPKACAMLGYSRDEFMSARDSAINPDEIQKLHEFIDSVNIDGAGWTDELRCLTKLGDVLATEISASMIMIDEKLCMVAIARPVYQGRDYIRHIEVQRNLAIEEERNRMSREIHDTLAQSLTLMVLKLDLIGEAIVTDSASVRAELKSVQLLATKCVEDARRSIWGLITQELESLGLVESIRIEMDRLKDINIMGEFWVSGAQEIAMDLRHQLAALRIVQESLSNIINHSNAKTGTVYLDFDVEFLSITIVDDGDGFEPRAARGISPAGGGFGITSMRERTRQIGGTVNIQSALGQGTTVEVRIPNRSDDSNIDAAS